MFNVSRNSNVGYFQFLAAYIFTKPGTNSTRHGYVPYAVCAAVELNLLSATVQDVFYLYSGYEYRVDDMRAE
jgi:hypothetical protein